MEMLTVVLITLSTAFLVVLALTWNSKDVNIQLLKIILILGLLIVNIIVGDVLMSILWGVTLLLNLIVLSQHSNNRE